MNKVWFRIVAGLISLGAWPGAALAEIRLVPDHPANRLAAVEVKGFAEEVLTLQAARPTEARLVIRADAPLELEKVEGGEARLRAGWDGTLGYSLYALEVKTVQGGPVVIRLHGVAAPTAPIPTSPSETAAVLDAFGRRGSRFPGDPQAFARWQQEYRGKLAGWLMGGSHPERVPLEARVISEEDREKFVLRRVRYRSLADRESSLLLAIPKGVARAPLLVALHGHEATWGEADAKAFEIGHADDFCAYFAKRGWAVLQPATMDHALQKPTWTLQGQWTWDAMVAIDYACTIEAIDRERVAVCGLSTGAHLAMNVLALDDRVRAGVVGCVLTTWHHYRQRFRIPPHCDCGIGAQLGPLLEACDWAALAAPKPVQFQHGRQDACFCPGADPARLDLKWNTGVMPQAEYDGLFAEIQRAYALAGKPEGAVTVYHDAGHRVDNEAAYEWLRRCIARNPADSRSVGTGSKREWSKGP